MVRRVENPRGALSIHVSAKVLSGASDETGISRVRRFISSAPKRHTQTKSARKEKEYNTNEKAFNDCRSGINSRDCRRVAETGGAPSNTIKAQLLQERAVAGRQFPSGTGTKLFDR